MNLRCISNVLLRSERRVAIIAGAAVGGCFFIGLIIIAILLLRRQLAKVEERKLRLTARISGIMACEVSRLRLQALRRHHIISGIRVVQSIQITLGRSPGLMLALVQRERLYSSDM